MFRKSILDRKKFISDIAVDVFFRKGFKESSLQDISLKAKLSKAGLYHYFRNKEDILYYILKNNTEIGIETLLKCVNENKIRNCSPIESFKNLIRAYTEYQMKTKKEQTLVMRERHQLTGKNMEKLKKGEQEIFSLFKSELKKVGSIHKKFNENVVSFSIISTLHWMAYWFDEKKELSLEQVMEQNIEIFLNGILEG